MCFREGDFDLDRFLLFFSFIRGGDLDFLECGLILRSRDLDLFFLCFITGDLDLDLFFGGDLDLKNMTIKLDHQATHN